MSRVTSTTGQSRRRFLKQTTAVAAGAAGAALWTKPAWVGAAGANEQRINLGFIGPGGQGMNLLQSFVQLPGVEVTWLCDIDDYRMADAYNHVKGVKGTSFTAPKQTKDLRKLLDDKSIDAVVVATPDHWHAPATIMACEAGKHVYVEKPASHNIREGRLMIEAARRNKRVVQVGTQSRSVPYLLEAMQMLRDGAIGEVLISKAWNSQRRGDIGRRQPTEPPPNVGKDGYDTWVGPAPFVPFQGNRFHGVWRWWYAFGTGDIGNDGVHDIDIARWGLGVDTHPDAVSAMGGKLFFDNDQEFPDTQYVVYQYNSGGGAKKQKQLIYEQRLWSPYVQEGYENGNAFYGTKGQLVVGKKHGWRLYEGDDRQPKKSNDSADSRLESTPHHRDFLQCVRSGDGEGKRPAADIEIGHLSSSLSHLGNIAARIGHTIKFDPKAEKVVGDEEANRLVSREYRQGHWSVPKGV
ncbi:MAG TPA: Gfo/Idh/MocA family oxidoreductase [Tepidisphaeraceae bacterium]|nr:Gfo/Idh/MocA family oxidoreductase [Tepidisphaeraceae bacterium]